MLTDGREIVENPECAPLGRGDQVGVVHFEVGDRHHRERCRKCTPLRATVVRQVEPRLGAGVEQIPAHGILAHHTDWLVLAQAIHHARPGATVIRGLEHVRRRVADAVGAVGHVHRRGVVWRHLDLVREAVRQALRRDVGPGRTAITRELHQAVVGADVDRLRIEW